MTATVNGGILVGADVLEIVTIAMYAEPLVIYRELIQNSADAIEQATRGGLIDEAAGNISVDLDRTTRTVTIRDNGFGLSNAMFREQMLALGASSKRTGNYRGFRGIGRLAGVGHFRDITFRSRADGDRQVMEVRWDSAIVQNALKSNEITPIDDIIRKATTFSATAESGDPKHFFEVRLAGARRLPDDRLFSEKRITEFLSQVAPVGFDPDFSHGEYITTELRRRAPLLQVSLMVGGKRVYKPYTDVIPMGRGKSATVKTVEFVEVPSDGDNLAAFGWIAQTDYMGAFNGDFGGRGLRVRSGNVQIGDEGILAAAFPEERFNLWSIGEFHVFDPRIRPNARRDAFEPGMAVDDLFNRLLPYGSSIARQCRLESRRRNMVKKSATLLSEARVIEAAFRGKRGIVAPFAREVIAKEIKYAIDALRAAAVESAQFKQNLDDAEACVKRMLRARGPRKSVPQRARGHLDMITWLFREGHVNLLEPAISALAKAH